MNTSTLRGIFPDPKPIHRRNFVRENIKSLKDMQGFAQGMKVASKSQEITTSKFKHVAPRVYSHMNQRRMSNEGIPNRPVSYNEMPKGVRAPMFPKRQFGEKKITHRGVQTDRPDEIKKLYETGPIKFPSPTAKGHEKGDNSPPTTTLQKLDLEEKQITTKKTKKEANDSSLPPPNQKGTLPKYLKDKKGINKANTDLESGENTIKGLVLLPDEERKEYLRVARDNYASLIKELNGMPVSNDTLKKRKRKMEIEEELKRLDEVIKIFQKPKVFVKADA